MSIMWINLSKKVNWLITLIGSCFISIFLVTLIANYFNVEIYHNSLWGMIKTITVLFFLPGYVGYKSMFIFGYAKEQSEVNIYAENFWGFSPITMLLPATMGWMFANNLYEEIKTNKKTHYEPPQYQYIPPQPIVINEPPPLQEELITQQDNRSQIELQSQEIAQNPNNDTISQKPQKLPISKQSIPEPPQQSIEKAHFDKILKVHPDAVKIIESSQFNNWLSSQSSNQQDYYNYVLDHGTATQVISLFSQYKADIRSIQNNVKAITIHTTQSVNISPQAIYEKYQKPLIPSENKPLEIQSTEKMPDLLD